jgi:hypothetical protein
MERCAPPSQIGGEAAYSADAGQDFILRHTRLGHAEAEFGGALLVAVTLQFITDKGFVADNETVSGEVVEGRSALARIEGAPAVGGVAAEFGRYRSGRQHDCGFQVGSAKALSGDLPGVVSRFGLGDTGVVEHRPPALEIVATHGAGADPGVADLGGAFHAVVHGAADPDRDAGGVLRS